MHAIPDYQCQLSDNPAKIKRSRHKTLRWGLLLAGIAGALAIGAFQLDFLSYLVGFCMGVALVGLNADLFR